MFLALGMSYQIAVYKCFANGATGQKGAISTNTFKFQQNSSDFKRKFNLFL